ncbi:MAG: MFS transporter, partial [Pseudomonadota bacterium]
VLVVALAVAAAGGVLAALAPTIEVAIAGRILQAGAAAAGITVARAVATDCYERDLATSFIARLTGVMVFMPMIAPAIGGELVVAFGWRSVFVLGAVLTVVVSVWVFFQLEETIKAKAPRVDFGHLFRGLAYAAESRVFWGLTLFSALQMGAFFSFVGSAPFVMAEAYGFGPEIYGRYFFFIAVIFMASNFVSSVAVKRLGAQTTLRIGAAISVFGVGVFVALMLAGLDGPVWLFVPAGINGVAGGFALPAAVSLAVLERSERAGAASSLVGFVQFLMAGLASQIGGAIPHGSALPSILLIWALGLAGVAAIGVLAPQRIGFRAFA